VKRLITVLTGAGILVGAVGKAARKSDGKARTVELLHHGCINRGVVCADVPHVLLGDDVLDSDGFDLVCVGTASLMRLKDLHIQQQVVAPLQ